MREQYQIDLHLTPAALCAACSGVCDMDLATKHTVPTWTQAAATTGYVLCLDAPAAPAACFSYCGAQWKQQHPHKQPPNGPPCSSSQAQEDSSSNCTRTPAKAAHPCCCTAAAVRACSIRASASWLPTGAVASAAAGCCAMWRAAACCCRAVHPAAFA
jgi:hypothetical protein